MAETVKQLVTFLIIVLMIIVCLLAILVVWEVVDRAQAIDLGIKVGASLGLLGLIAVPVIGLTQKH